MLKVAEDVNKLLRKTVVQGMFKENNRIGKTFISLLSHKEIECGSMENIFEFTYIVISNHILPQKLLDSELTLSGVRQLKN